MTFEDALEAMFNGKVVRREGWTDPDRFAYLILEMFDGDYSVLTARVSEEDSLQDDWYIWGSVQ
jgi:hypothetical protein